MTYSKVGELGMHLVIKKDKKKYSNWNYDLM